MIIIRVNYTTLNNIFHFLFLEREYIKFHFVFKKIILLILGNLFEVSTRHDCISSLYYGFGTHCRSVDIHYGAVSDQVLCRGRCICWTPFSGCLVLPCVTLIDQNTIHIEFLLSFSRLHFSIWHNIMILYFLLSRLFLRIYAPIVFLMNPNFNFVIFQAWLLVSLRLTPFLKL